MATKIATFTCAEAGCSERAHFEYSNRAESADLYRRYHNQWKCIRHSKPDSVLSVTNKAIESSYVAGKSAKYPELTTLFWSGPDHTSGFISGPAFRAWAKDFPEGTKLTVRAEITLPPNALTPQPED